MRTLIVATNATSTGVAQEIRIGKHYRIDYMELSTRLATAYVDYNTVPHNRPARWLEEKLRLDVHQALQVARTVHKQHYDVVLSMSERVGIPLAHMLSPGVKHVVIMHHPLSPPKLTLMRLLRVHRRWNAVVAISRAEAEALRKAFSLDLNRVKVLNTPVDTEFFKPGKRAVTAKGQDHVQSLGLSYRDYPTLIAAMRTLPHITCHLRVGSAWVRGEAGFKGETLPGNVEIKPYVHPSVLRECYSESRFIIVPIRQTTQWSAGCTSVQLAQAMGKAVIATHMPGLSDYVLDGETGVLVEGGNPAAMAEAIDYLWNSPEKAAAMGHRGREWVQARFSLDEWVDNVANMLNTLAAI